ncbi:MAG: cell division protein SepF [Candidatus Aenigmarchaeota archaeon]|nr:cell division protein SepF [Candidatus Aenigmarchaeota archaeon]
MLKELLGKFKSTRTEGKTEEEFLEVDSSLLGEQGKVSVRIEHLKGFADTEKVQQLVREGNVVFLKIRELRDKDINELKRCVDRLRKTCLAMNGDIVGVDEDFLIITPDFARVFRGKAA